MTQEEALSALANCRKAIDDVDLRILQLLNERTKIVEEIGRVRAKRWCAGGEVLSWVNRK